MNHNQLKLGCLLSIGLLFCGCAANKQFSEAAKSRSSGSEVVDRYVAAMRDDLSRGKVGIITQVMQLNSEQAKVFWPIYQEYESELFDLGDLRIEAIRQFVKDEGSGKLDN